MISNKINRNLINSKWKILSIFEVKKLFKLKMCKIEEIVRKVLATVYR